jgi:hypothetical protein
MVGSTRNQWPIIINENTEEISKIGNILLKFSMPTSLNISEINDINDKAR